MSKRSVAEELKRLKASAKDKTNNDGGQNSTQAKETQVDKAVAMILEDMRVRQERMAALEDKMILMRREAALTAEKEKMDRLRAMAKRDSELLAQERWILDGELEVWAELDGLISRGSKTVGPVISQKIDDIQSTKEKVEREEDNRAGGMLLGGEESFKRRTSTDRAGTGLRRLDDLLNGGLPVGCNILINGTRNTGKEILAKHLVAQGLRDGVPALWVITDTDPLSIRREMSLILPDYEEYESKGLLKYVDLYSLDLGIAIPDPNVTFISVSHQGDFFEQLGQSVEKVVQGFLKIAKHYNLVFQSVSTLTTAVDSRTTMRFLMPFVGRRLRENAVSYYLVDTGMHTASDIDLLEHMMDGTIEMKEDKTKTMFAVKGVVDKVQSRSWVNYTFSKTSIEIGSFSLGHIR